MSGRARYLFGEEWLWVFKLCGASPDENMPSCFSRSCIDDLTYPVPAIPCASGKREHIETVGEVAVSDVSGFTEAGRIEVQMER